ELEDGWGLVLVRDVHDAHLREQPLAIGRNLFVGHNQDIAARNRQSGVGGAADVGAEFEVAHEGRPRKNTDVQDDQSGVPPPAVRALAANQRMVQRDTPGAWLSRVAFGRRPAHRLVSGGGPARKTTTARLSWPPPNWQGH